MSLESLLQEAIEKTAEAIIPVMVTEGKVTKVDKEANTCNVEREDLPELFKVRLNAITSPGTNIVSIYPKVGSRVLVVLVENNKTDAYVLTATDIEEIIINGGTNGGIIKIENQTQKLNKLVTELTTELTKVATGITGAGGAYTPGALSQFDKADYENEKIKH